VLGELRDEQSDPDLASLHQISDPRVGCLLSPGGRNSGWSDRKQRAGNDRRENGALPIHRRLLTAVHRSAVAINATCGVVESSVFLDGYSYLASASKCRKSIELSAASSLGTFAPCSWWLSREACRKPQFASRSRTRSFRRPSPTSNARLARACLIVPLRAW